MERPVVDLDWVAVQGIGSVLAAVIAVVAYLSSKRSAQVERERNQKQDELDAQQGEYIASLAEAVRKMADLQEGQLLDLARRVSQLETVHDPSHSEQRKREADLAEEQARRELRDLDARLDTIILPSRDAFAGAPPGEGEPKRVIRLKNNRVRKERP